MKTWRLVLFAFLMAALFFTACSRTRRNALGVELDRIDRLILQAQYRDAASELRKIEKRVSSSWDYISIYRRYNEIGISDRAAQVIQDAFKKHSQNAEVRALYVHHLLRAGNEEDAAKNAESLRGTRYGSIYSEAMLKYAAKQSSETSNATAPGLAGYLLPELFSVYYDAYSGSKNSYWLRNAAIIGMMSGNVEQVRLLRPERYTSFSDAYFWALIQFDSGNFGESELALTQARSLYETSSRRDRANVTEVEFAALASDVYQALSENERAEYARKELLSGGGNFDDSAAALPYIYLNSAEWAVGVGKDDDASRLLTETVTRWPDFVPGLISYADFAYRTSQPRIENEAQRALRESGVATLEMQRYDNRAQIPVADAAARISASIERNREPLLYIAQLDFRYKTDKTLSAENKIADMWSVLERNTIGINQYPPLLLEYAVNMLIRHNRMEDAFTLFKQFCVARYGFDNEADFWQQVFENADLITGKEMEYIAWFAANAGLGTTAQKAYESCVWQSGSRKQLSAAISVEACINLAMIYSSLGNKNGALELYAAAAGRTPDNTQKAEIMYRMALIYEQTRNMAEALRTVAIACTLDPLHARAQLLYSRLSVL